MKAPRRRCKHDKALVVETDPLSGSDCRQCRRARRKEQDQSGITPATTSQDIPDTVSPGQPGQPGQLRSHSGGRNNAARVTGNAPRNVSASARGPVKMFNGKPVYDYGPPDEETPALRVLPGGADAQVKPAVSTANSALKNSGESTRTDDPDSVRTVVASGGSVPPPFRGGGTHH